MHVCITKYTSEKLALGTPLVEGMSGKYDQKPTQSNILLLSNDIVSLTIQTVMISDYHSKFDISGHLTKRYIPLLYLNPGGLLMYSANTFPVYMTACKSQIKNRMNLNSCYAFGRPMSNLTTLTMSTL